MLSTHFNLAWIEQLLKSSNKTITGTYMGVEYQAKIVIPDYKMIVADYYKDIIETNINDYCRQAEVSMIYDHYGTLIEFDKPIQMDVHGEEQVIEPGLKQLMQRAGPVLIKNAYLSAPFREVQQRNSFPHLNFHIDRNISMPTRFSVYTRDPFDEEQKHPRESSTLFMASIAGYLQAVKEGLIDPQETRGINQSFEIFRQTDLTDLMGKLVIEQRWDEPDGTGEMSMLDNATELHSSYERRYGIKGYRIGVRYLA
jgi:hypothetical protein